MAEEKGVQVEPKFFAVWYLPGTLLHRGSTISDNAEEFAASKANKEAQGFRWIDATKMRVNHPPPWPVEAIQRIIAEAEGVEVRELPSGRCAVVSNKDDLAVDFKVACPFTDMVTEEHGFDDHRLVATDEAQMHWKHHKGAWLARKVAVNAEGRVLGVMWLPPATKDFGGQPCHDDSFAKPGDTLAQFKRVNVAMGETEKF